MARSDAGFQQLLKERDYYQWAINNPKEYNDQQLKNSYSFIASDLAEKEINENVDALKKAYQAENDYLSVGILFPKYSTLPAVTSMSEYFATGRCTELAGPTGAYNLYESELRADAIIEKLDIISEKLDDIKRNQYMLFRAIQNVNSQLSRLNSTADNMRKELNTGLSSINNHLLNISDNTAVIAYNTEVTAYYSKRNAELTDSLGYLIALK